MGAIPCPDVTRYDGVLNFAAHFPKEGPSPDLGESRAYIVKIYLIGKRAIRA